jgi:hypothetical protein
VRKSRKTSATTINRFNNHGLYNDASCLQFYVAATELMLNCKERGKEVVVNFLKY